MKKNCFLAHIILQSKLFLAFSQFIIFFYIHGVSDSLREVRKQVIQALVDQYKKPIGIIENNTQALSPMLDLIATNTHATFFLLPQDPTAEAVLYNLCCKHTYTNVLLFKNNLSENLAKLSECEDFDIVIDFSLFTQLDSWERKIEILKHLGSCVLIEIPLNLLSEQQALIQKHMPESFFFDAKHHHMYLTIKTSTKSLRRNTWQGKYKLRNTPTITSTLSTKTLTKRLSGTLVTTEWIPGINLITYKMAGVSYPTIPQIWSSLEQLFSQLHDDWGPYNLLVSGSNVLLIDTIFTNIPILPTHKEKILLKKWLFSTHEQETLKLYDQF